MKLKLCAIASSILLSACTATGGSAYNKTRAATDPVTGENTMTYRIELDNSTGILTAGSVGGAIDILCSEGKLNAVTIHKAGSNGWLQVKFDQNPHLEFQGTNNYPFDRQQLNKDDARLFLANVMQSKSAIMKVGSHAGFHVMKAHLDTLPKKSMATFCGAA